MSELPVKEEKHILCPVDFSEPSSHALNSAILHARKIGARLTVISVFEPVRFTSSNLLKYGIDEESKTKELFSMYKREFAAYLDNFDFTGVEINHELFMGNPVEKIIQYSSHAPILYIGSTGKSGLRRVLLGSVTEKVIREVSCNVVVVKSEELFKLRIPADLADIEKHFSRGEELTVLGFIPEAITQYKNCLEVNELHLPSIRALAMLYERLGEQKHADYYKELSRIITSRMMDRKIEEEVRRHFRSAG